MKRLRSLKLCDSGIDQPACQLNEVAYMCADRQVYTKLWEFTFYFMGGIRPKAFEIQCFQRHFWHQQLQAIFQQSTCMLDLSTVFPEDFRFLVYSIRKLNQSTSLPLQCYAQVTSFLFAHWMSCTFSVLRLYVHQNKFGTKVLTNLIDMGEESVGNNKFIFLTSLIHCS